MLSENERRVECNCRSQCGIGIVMRQIFGKVRFEQRRNGDVILFFA
jgi:hypothetical protein